MRQYARELLGEAAEATTLEARHHAFYLELARAADPECAVGGPIVAAGRLDADHDNLRAAIGWALRHEPEQALRLAVHMWPMWMARLHEVPAGDREAFFRVHTTGLFVAAEAPARAPRMYFEETALFFRRGDARRAIGYVLAALGDVARAQGLSEPARERLTESLAHFREARDAMGTAFALNRLGNLAGALGEHELGREWLEEGLTLRRELGDRRGAGMTLGNLGILAVRAGDPERGRSFIGEALTLFEETDDAPGQTGMRLNLGNVAADVGEPARARELLEASRELAEPQRLFRCAGWSTLMLAELAVSEGDAERAARLLDAALERLRPLGDRWGVARCLELDQAVTKGSLSPARQG
jgi:tetratricopeptide (TPR) repeat protein